MLKWNRSMHNDLVIIFKAALLDLKPLEYTDSRPTCIVDLADIERKSISAYLYGYAPPYPCDILGWLSLMEPKMLDMLTTRAPVRMSF